MDSGLEYIARNLHLVVLPCRLWAVHVDPQYSFIAVVRIKVAKLEIQVDRAILLTPNGGDLQICYMVNNKTVDFPHLDCNLKSISQLSNVICCLDNLKLCSNSTQYVFEGCLQIVENNSDDFCSSCKSQTRTAFTPDISDNEVPQMDINDIANVIEKYNTLTADDIFEGNTIVNQEETKLPEESCEFCIKTFSTKSALRQHIRIHNLPKKLHVCHICKKTSSSRSSHLRHVQIHSNKKPNLCNVCGKTFCQGYRIEDHMLTHSSKKPYECSICNKLFAKTYNLKIHQRTHTGERPYICSTCGKSYTTRSNLQTHVISAHKEKKPHACGACNMTFAHPRLLRIHMRKHTGERPYHCQTCGKAFSKNIHLTIHTRTHSGEKPHVCGVCKKGFTTTGNLNSHMRVHHNSTS